MKGLMRPEPELPFPLTAHWRAQTEQTGLPTYLSLNGNEAAWWMQQQSPSMATQTVGFFILNSILPSKQMT